MQQKDRPRLPEQTVPYDLNAEAAILAQIMMHGRAELDAALAIVQPEHFFSPKHRKIFEAMIGIARAGGNPGDPVLLRSWLAAHGDLQFVGGQTGLISVLDGVSE